MAFMNRQDPEASGFFSDDDSGETAAIAAAAAMENEDFSYMLREFDYYTYGSYIYFCHSFIASQASIHVYSWVELKRQYVYIIDVSCTKHIYIPCTLLVLLAPTIYMSI